MRLQSMRQADVVVSYLRALGLTLGLTNGFSTCNELRQ